mgnify:CR=1 FL=1
MTDQLFATLDVDGDGRITSAEWIRAFTASEKQREEGRGSEALDGTPAVAQATRVGAPAAVGSDSQAEAVLPTTGHVAVDEEWGLKAEAIRIFKLVGAADNAAAPCLSPVTHARLWLSLHPVLVAHTMTSSLCRARVFGCVMYHSLRML